MIDRHGMSYTISVSNYQFIDLYPLFGSPVPLIDFVYPQFILIFFIFFTLMINPRMVSKQLFLAYLLNFLFHIAPDLSFYQALYFTLCPKLIVSSLHFR